MPSQSVDTPRGFAFAASAYLIWGLILPIYLKLLGHVSPLEIVAHRVIWALPFALLILLWLGLLPGLTRVLSWRLLGLALVTATLISANWGTYVYAIVTGHGVEAALGYYINPLINVLMAAAFLGERPTRLQGTAIALAAVGVVIMTIAIGSLPWISLVLALTFGSYGLLRKTIPVGATEGFFLEVSLLILPALAIAGWTFANGTNHFGRDAFETTMLVGAGPLTAAPLILFAAGARLLRFTTIGLLQYFVPTLLFLTAVFVFGEPFNRVQLVAFAFIWAGLAVYTWPLLRRRAARRAVAREPTAAR